MLRNDTAENLFEVWKPLQPKRVLIAKLLLGESEDLCNLNIVTLTSMVLTLILLT